MASTSLTRTPSSSGNQKTWTLSTWVKKPSVGTQPSIIDAFYGNQSRYSVIYFDTNDNLNVFSGLYTTGASTTTSTYLITNRKFRDTNAWYHIVVTYDSTNATQSDRTKLWINGVRETSFSTETYPSLNDDTFFNVTTTINRVGENGFDGLMSHLHFIDGTAYDASAFGQTDATTGIWTAKTAPSVTYGNNGFFLKFENSGSMGTDSSGNGNNFTVNGTLTQTLDTPSNVYCTMSPIDHILGNFTNGNLANESVTNAGDTATRGTLAVNKGKWYWEAKYVAYTGTGATTTFIGIHDTGTKIETSGATNSYWYNVEVGSVAHNATYIVTGLSSWSVNSIVGVGYDADNGDLYFWTNGVAENSGNPVVTGIDTTKTFAPNFVIHYGASNTSKWLANFGNGYFGTTAVSSGNSDADGHGIFEYPVPSGFYALNTKNLATYG